MAQAKGFFQRYLAKISRQENFQTVKTIQVKKLKNIEVVE